MNSIHSCRSCGAVELEVVLRLGKTPLANALISYDDLNRLEETYPLDLAVCTSCTLVQITETVPPEKLFSEYLYFSSFSDTMLQHAARIVDRMVQGRKLSLRSLAIEIASNDGYLLQYYKQKDIPVLGIEPANNVALVAQKERNVRTICEFFNEELATSLATKHCKADVLHANNVLAHIADLNGFVRGIKILLKDDGIAVIEVPYLKDLIDRCEFDTIYHEHLCYFSFTALIRLFERHGLRMQDVERIPIHGGSLRIFVTKESGAEPNHAVRDLLVEENDWAVGNIETYRSFARRVEELKLSLRGLLSNLKLQRQHVAAYGAAAKGSTLLNYFNIGQESLDFVVDRSIYKQGRYMPGVHLPIHSPEKLLEEMPSHVLLLTWNFADEILEQQAEYRRRGGKFIIPIPELQVV